jgi:hypothetical protein
MGPFVRGRAGQLLRRGRRSKVATSTKRSAVRDGLARGQESCRMPRRARSGAPLRRSCVGGPPRKVGQTRCCTSSPLGPIPSGHHLARRRAIQPMERGMSKRASTGPLASAARDALPRGEFAFPLQRKEPLEDASHVRNAIARFRQVAGVTDAERDTAWNRIRLAATRFGVEVGESDWRELGDRSARRGPQ